MYGDAETYPTPETALPRPVSPYGVTKLAAEHLCTLYGLNFGVPTVSLRYFTVYGPRQRTDMALRRMIDRTLAGEAFTLYGDGSVSRSFTYVDDVVAANVAALFHEDLTPGTVLNVADESTVSMSELIDLVGAATRGTGAHRPPGSRGRRRPADRRILAARPLGARLARPHRAGRRHHRDGHLVPIAPGWHPDRRGPPSRDALSDEPMETT